MMADSEHRTAVRNKFPHIVNDDTYGEPSPFGLSFAEDRKRDNDYAASAGLSRFYTHEGRSTPPQPKELKSSPNHDMYLAHQQAGLSQPQLQQFDVPYSQPDTVTYPAAPLYQERPADGTAYNTVRTRNPMPEVTEWTPQLGAPGENMVIMLMSAYEVDPTWRFEAHFGNCAAPCSITMNESKGVYYELALSVEIPHSHDATWTNPKVTLDLEARDANDTSVGVVPLGTFAYTGLGGVRHSSIQPSPPMSRKRRLSADTDISCPLPQAKRIASQQQHLRATSESAYEQQPFGYITQSPSMLALDAGVGDSYHHKLASNPIGSSHGSPKRHSQPIVTSTGQLQQRPSPATSSWAGTPVSTHSPAPTSRKATGLSPIMVNPKLCRTTTLQQSPSPASTPLGTPAATTFNPYAMLPFNKAVLKISGDLEDMCKDWSKDENEAGRRLVHFWRTQTGSTITTNFKPVTPEERQPSFICVSCIWWEAKKEHFVTSVDTIYLLENLVGGRFTVEEKNRIRRNLEGFRPLTVSKGKSDSEDFFKLIMGFPNPKPRNIEKDVKVFPWKILSHALKKIMGKYSASYSSMASAIPQSAPGYHAPDVASAGLIGPVSPHSADGAMPAGYDPAVLSTLANPDRIPMSYAAPQNSMVAVASSYPMYAAYPSGGMPSGMMSAPPHQQHHRAPMVAAPYRHAASWDYSNTGGYLDSGMGAVSQSMNPAVAAHAHAHAHHGHHGHHGHHAHAHPHAHVQHPNPAGAYYHMAHAHAHAHASQGA